METIKESRIEPASKLESHRELETNKGSRIKPASRLKLKGNFPGLYTVVVCAKCYKKLSGAYSVPYEKVRTRNYEFGELVVNNLCKQQ